MNILLSAIACNPVTGSDAFFGWSAAKALASIGDVHVLTHGFSREFIRAEDEAALQRVQFHFVGQPKPVSRNGLLARVQSWEECRDWQDRLVLPFARDLHAREKFDVVHHVTISSWRLTSPLWKLGIPFIWGPLGGGEETPRSFRHLLSLPTRVFEVLRRISSIRAARSRNLRNCARASSIALAANKETARLLTQIECPRVEIISPAFFSPSRIFRFESQLPLKNWNRPLRIFSGGNLEGRKGVSLSLQALARLKREGIPFFYQIGGGGAERPFLQKMAARLGLEPEDVEFGEGLSGSDYDDALRRTHVYLLPSLRENAGLTMMEAMLAGCVPIVLKLGGPGEIVTKQCGFPIEATSPAEAVRAITSILQLLDRDRQLCQRIGLAACTRIQTCYSESAYLAALSQCYDQALQ